MNKKSKSPTKEDLGGKHAAVVADTMLKLLDDHLKGCQCPKCKKDNKNRK